MVLNGQVHLGCPRRYLRDPSLTRCMNQSEEEEFFQMGMMLLLSQWRTYRYVAEQGMGNGLCDYV